MLIHKPATQPVLPCTSETVTIHLIPNTAIQWHCLTRCRR